MSIVSKKQRQQPATATLETETSRRGTMSGTMYPWSWSRRKRRSLTIFAIIFLGLLLLVGLLPAIIAHTPLMAYSVRRAAMLEGTITFRSASIGWFSSTSLSGIEIRDAQNETVLQADSLTCDRSLLQLLRNSSNVGTLRIQKPRLSAKLTRDGSNVQAVLARWLTGPGSSSSQGVDLSVEVVDGEATIVDQETQQSWHVGDLQFALDMSRQKTWPTRMEGKFTYQGDLERLQAWIVAATGSTGLRLAGRLSGTAQVQQTEGQIVCKNESDVEQLAVAAPSGQSFQEPQVHCALQCSYQIADNTLKIDQCELSSGAAGARAAGQIVLSKPGDVQLSGDVSYQWDKLNLLLQPYWGDSIQFYGAGTSPIAYRGPFSPAQGQASAALQFSGANLYGFQVGPGELKAHLADGVLQADLPNVTCNQGRLALQAELHMDRQPMEFRLSAGTLARQIQLDQAACRSALKYVVPVLASVTQSQGQFSIQLDGCRIPIGDLSHAEIAGRIIVHSATMSPGPLIQELASLVTASPSLIHIEPESVIQFRMTGGRIYHQGLALQFPDVTMRTYGSVGLDDSLKLMVETSVPLKWLPNNAVSDAIRKQKMQIPVGGTLKSPQLDLGELARVKNQVLGNLTRSVLQSELGNQLNRLLQPQR